MWSPDFALPRNAALALGLLAATLVGGCQVQPLYGPAAVGTGGMTSTALADVDVAPVEGRVGQQVRNDLLFYMNGGAESGGSYIVDLNVQARYTNVLTRSISGLPGGRNLRLQVRYTLKKVGEEGTLTTGTVTRIASLDYFNQRFANDRAMIDAENRAAKEAAADIHLRLASFFATGKSYKVVDTEEPDDDALTTTGDTIFDDQEQTYGAPQL